MVRKACSKFIADFVSSDTSYWRKLVVLQCGHDPEVVENSSSPTTRERSRPLQCGHDPEVVENVRQSPHRLTG